MRSAAPIRERCHSAARSAGTPEAAASSRPSARAGSAQSSTVVRGRVPLPGRASTAQLAAPVPPPMSVCVAGAHSGAASRERGERGPYRLEGRGHPVRGVRGDVGAVAQHGRVGRGGPPVVGDQPLDGLRRLRGRQPVEQPGEGAAQGFRGGEGGVHRQILGTPAVRCPSRRRPRRHGTGTERRRNRTAGGTTAVATLTAVAAHATCRTAHGGTMRQRVVRVTLVAGVIVLALLLLLSMCGGGEVRAQARPPTTSPASRCGTAPAPDPAHRPVRVRHPAGLGDLQRLAPSTPSRRTAAVSAIWSGSTSPGSGCAPSTPRPAGPAGPGQPWHPPASADQFPAAALRRQGRPRVLRDLVLRHGGRGRADHGRHLRRARCVRRRGRRPAAGRGPVARRADRLRHRPRHPHQRRPHQERGRRPGLRRGDPGRRRTRSATPRAVRAAAGSPRYAG